MRSDARSVLAASAAATMMWAMAAWAQPAPNPPSKPTPKAAKPAPATVGDAVNALDELARAGDDWTALWGVMTPAERDRVRDSSARVAGMLKGLTLSDDERAVVLGRVLALAGASAPDDRRATALGEARALLERVEGPPTAGEAARRVTLAAVLIAEGGEAELKEAESLARSVLDLPRGDDPAAGVPRSTHVEATLALILTARSHGRDPAATAGVGRGQFGEARERLAIAEALARALAPGAGAPREAWNPALDPLREIGRGPLGELSGERAKDLADAKIAALTAVEPDADRLPTDALLASADPARVQAAVDRAGKTEEALDALWRLADVYAAASPRARADEIETVCRFIERAPKGRRADEALRRATRCLEEWERAIMDGPWRRAKPPADVAPDADIIAINAASWRVVSVLGAMGRTDSTRARLEQRVARMAIRAGKARGQWGDKAIEVLRAVWDDPAVTGETVNLSRQWLEQRHPKKNEADAGALWRDLQTLGDLPTFKRQPYQLAVWRVTLAEALARAGDHAGALAEWEALSDGALAPYVPGDLDRVLLAMAAQQRALSRDDDALKTLERITGRFEQALAGQRPPAFWEAWARALRIQLDRDPSPGAAAAVRLRIRQLRAADPTLGGGAWREELEKMDGEAAGR